jgi:hypothetical protein
MLLAQSDTEATGVRVIARRRRQSDTAQLFDIEFVRRELQTRKNHNGEAEFDHIAPVPVRIVTSWAGVTADQLKSIYAEVFGDHVL